MESIVYRDNRLRGARTFSQRRTTGRGAFRCAALRKGAVASGASHLHAHDFLISLNHLVSNLEEKSELHFVALGCQNHVVDFHVVST